MASAHFQLQFPAPRGVFDQDNEPTFCDGYDNPATNRTQFPLTGGFFTLNSEHPQWTLGVFVSSAANATSFSDFSQVKPFFQDQGEGGFCVPLDFSSNANGSSLTAGQNVTIQVEYNGGDGNLFQCADLTLSNGSNLLSGVTCTNATNSTGTGKSSAIAERVSVIYLVAMIGACGIGLIALY